MITIRKPTISHREGKARVSADIDVDGKVYPLWYEVEERFGQYLCADYGDPWVIGLLKEVIIGRHEVVSEAPCSEDLIQNLTEVFSPTMCAANPSMEPLRISAERIASDGCGGGVGCSITCGVDSMYTMYMHRHEVTHVVINNCHGGTAAKDKRALFDELVEHAREVAQEASVALIVGDTNYDGASAPGLVFENHSTLANLFAVYCLRGLFARYYLATGYSVNEMFLSPVQTIDVAHYDLLLTQVCSVHGLKVIADGMGTRLDKVRALVDFPLAQRHLDVCWNGHAEGTRNGTWDCPKCMRTVLELLAVGGDEALGRFAATFDVDYVKSHRGEYLAELLRGLIQRNEYALQAWPYRGRMGFTLGDWCRAIVIVLRKMTKKVLRGGSTSGVFSPRG